MNQTVTENHRLRDTIIIGAGLTGLTTAYCLTRKGCDIEVIEQSPCVGGQIRTYHENGFTFESGPRSRTLVASAMISGPMPSPAKRAILTSIVVIVYFNDIQHFDSRLDGGLRLVGVQSAGLEFAPVHLPGDDRLHEGVGTASRRDRNGIVAQHRKLAFELMLVDLPQGPHEGVVLAVARRGLLVFPAVDFDPKRRDGMQSLRKRKAVIENPNRIFDLVVAQHVGNDVAGHG